MIHWIGEVLWSLLGQLLGGLKPPPRTMDSRRPDPAQPTRDGQPAHLELVVDQELPMQPFASSQNTIYSVLSVIETGKLEPDYGSAHVLADGAGITFGKHQSTDRSDSLDAILWRYIDKGGSLSVELALYMPWLKENGTAGEDPGNLSERCQELIDVLHATGTDPVMHEAQDFVFRERYWQPAISHALHMGLQLPLSMLVCYDTQIHSGNGSGSIANIRKRFPEVPPSGGGDEKAWVRAYLEARREWLLTIPHAAFTV